jgi:hypothetical protein
MLMFDDSRSDAVQEIEHPRQIEHPRHPRARAVFSHPIAWFGTALLALTVGTGPAIGYVGIILFAVSLSVALWRVAVAVQKRSGLSVLGNLAMAGFSAMGMLVSYMSTMVFSRGRQLRRFGRLLLPGLREEDAWTTARVSLDAHGAPEGLAGQWRENGKTEHASVAAFARLTLDLMALGAPPPLIAAANQDALDEIRHTQLCFSLARALDGRAISPGPFPQAQRAAALPRLRLLALARLAVDSLVDGALHEGVSARIIAKLAQRCEVPGITGVLREIAADEGRHSAHGWAVVAWCLEEGGRPVAEALRGAVRALPHQMRSALPRAASVGQWERWGIHGHSLEAVEYAAALAHVRERVGEMSLRAMVVEARSA